MALREANAAQLIVVSDADGTYAFRHALLQEAIYDDMLPRDRRRCHARCAEGLAARPVPDGAEGASQLAALAHHATAAHDLPLALRGWVEAARASARVNALVGGGRGLRSGARHVGCRPRGRPAGRGRCRPAHVRGLAGAPRQRPAQPGATGRRRGGPSVRRCRRPAPRGAAPRALCPRAVDDRRPDHVDRGARAGGRVVSRPAADGRIGPRRGEPGRHAHAQGPQRAVRRGRTRGRRDGPRRGRTACRGVRHLRARDRPCEPGRLRGRAAAPSSGGVDGPRARHRGRRLPSHVRQPVDRVAQLRPARGSRRGRARGRAMGEEAGSVAAPGFVPRGERSGCARRARALGRGPDPARPARSPHRRGRLAAQPRGRGGASPCGPGGSRMLAPARLGSQRGREPARRPVHGADLRRAHRARDRRGAIRRRDRPDRRRRSR